MNPGPRVSFLGRRGLFPRSLPLSLLLPSPHILASFLRVREELWAMGNHDGVVLLRNMPKAVYVKIDDSQELFLKAAPVKAGKASQLAGPDLRGVLALTPQARPWPPPPHH